MANTENTCHHLELVRLDFPEWDRIFELQKKLQERLGYDFQNMTLKEVVDFFLLNKHALEDELGELMDALGGIHDGIGNSVWKRWKNNNKLASEMTFNSLTDRDKLEILFEIVDAFHFMINFAIALGFTGSDIASAYITKNIENHNRKDNNY